MLIEIGTKVRMLDGKDYLIDFNEPIEDEPVPDTLKQVIIYTDGNCKGSGRRNSIGGWGVLLQYGEHKKELYGYEVNTTNNRMELLAAIVGLESLKQSCDVTIYTDSKYVQMGITTWIKLWQKNGWKNSTKQPVANEGLWKRLLKVSEPHNIKWQWVKGHNGNSGNEYVDDLATKAIITRTTNYHST